MTKCTSMNLSPFECQFSLIVTCCPAVLMGIQYGGLAKSKKLLGLHQIYLLSSPSTFQTCNFWKYDISKSNFITAKPEKVLWMYTHTHALINRWHIHFILYPLFPHFGLGIISLNLFIYLMFAKHHINEQMDLPLFMLFGSKNP